MANTNRSWSQQSRSFREYREARQEFFTWTKWWATTTATTGRNEECAETLEENPPDITDVIKLLRALGFQLRSIEEVRPETEVKNFSEQESQPKSRSCHVVLTCDNSHQRVVLVSTSVMGKCSCPSIEQAEEQRKWNVSGSVPTTSQEQLHTQDTAGSSLFPAMHHGKSMVAREVLTQLFKMFNNVTNSSDQIAVSSKQSSGLTPVRYRSLDTLTSVKTPTVVELPLPKPISCLERSMEDMELEMPIGTTAKELQASEERKKHAKPPLLRQSTWTENLPESTACSSEFFRTDYPSLIQHLSVAKKEIKAVMTMLNHKMDDSETCSVISSINGSNSNSQQLNNPRVETAKYLPLNTQSLPPSGKQKIDLSRGASIPRRTLSNLSALMFRDKTRSALGKATQITTPVESALKKRCLPSTAPKITLPKIPVSGPASGSLIQDSKRRLTGKCSSTSSLMLSQKPGTSTSAGLPAARTSIASNARTPTSSKTGLIASALQLRGPASSRSFTRMTSLQLPEREEKGKKSTTPCKK